MQAVENLQFLQPFSQTYTILGLVLDALQFAKVSFKMWSELNYLREGEEGAEDRRL